MGTDAHKDVVGIDVHATKEAPNLIENGAFQIWSNGISAQPDGVSDEGTPTVDQAAGERDNFFDTPFSVKYTATGAGNEGGKITLSRLKASTSYGVHIRAKVTAGDTARIFTVGAGTEIDQETSLTDWTSLFATFTTDATPADVVIKFVAKADGDIVWFDSLIVVEGDVIPTFAPTLGGSSTNANLQINSLGVGVAATGTQGQIKMQAADGQDTILTMVTTTNAHTINLFLDASEASNAVLVYENPIGGSPSSNIAFFRIKSNVGSRSRLELWQSSSIFSSFEVDTQADLYIKNERIGADIFFFVKDVGGTSRNIFTIDGTNSNVIIQNTVDAASNQVVIFKGGNRGSPLDNDEAYNSYFLDDSTGTQVEFMRQTWIATDVTNTTKAAGYQIELMQNNTLRDYMHFSAAVGADTGIIEFNKSEVDVDFNVGASGITSAFLVQGSSGNVGFGISTPKGKIEVAGEDANIESWFTCYSTTDGHEARINLMKSASGNIGTLSETADNEDLGVIGFYGIDSSGNADEAARIFAEQDGASTATEVKGDLSFWTNNGTALTRVMTITSGSSVGIGTASITSNQKLDVVFADDTEGAGIIFRNSDGAIEFSNNTGTANVFDPLIEGTPKGVGRMFEIRGNYDDDTASAFPAVRIRGQFSGGAQVNRPIFDIVNHTTTRMVVQADGRVFMPAVYSDVISGSTRDLFIKDDGQLGYLVSSRKYKTHIRYLDEIDYDISWLYNLRPALCDSKIDNSEKDLMVLIAEDVNLINSKLVSYKRTKGAVQKDGKDVYYDTDEPETVNYNSPYFTTSLLKAVQDLRKDVDSLMA